MKIALQQKEETKFQMAPMIDMVFLLVIFFMCASKMTSSRSLPLNIPKASKAVLPKERTSRWVVNITKEGQIFSQDQRVTEEELKQIAAARLKSNPNLRAYIRADADAKHKDVKTTMNAIASVGVDEFIFGVYSLEARGLE